MLNRSAFKPMQLVLSSKFQAFKNSLYDSSHVTAEKDDQTDITPEKSIPQHNFASIQNKVALINGGTDAIGSRCVSELLLYGARGVMIADSNVHEGKEKVAEFAARFGPDKVAFIQINPASFPLVKNAFVSTMNHFKGLDIVINNMRFKERNWEESVDQNIKAMVLSTELCLEFMGRDNGGNGGIIVNISCDFEQESACGPLCLAAQDFIVRFDRSIADARYNSSSVKVLTICKATFDSIDLDLATVIIRGNNGCVWMPEP